MNESAPDRPAPGPSRFPLPDRPVAFVKYYEKASTILGADQIAEGLRRRGADARSIPASRIGEIRRGILVFIKKMDLPHALLSRWNRNRIVLDIQDTIVFRPFIKNQLFAHGFLFKNRRQLADYGRLSRYCAVMPHQWDPRLTPNRAGSGFRIGYFGDARSLAFWEDLPEVEFVGNDELFERAPEFNAHLNVRQPGREWIYKTNSKVVFAAGCRAVLVTTPDVATVEELGEDYPFYVEPTREGVREGIERARGAYGGPEWKRALATLDRVREERTLERVVDLYCEYFEGLRRHLESAGP